MHIDIEIRTAASTIKQTVIVKLSSEQLGHSNEDGLPSDQSRPPFFTGITLRNLADGSYFVSLKSESDDLDEYSEESMVCHPDPDDFQTALVSVPDWRNDSRPFTPITLEQ